MVVAERMEPAGGEATRRRPVAVVFAMPFGGHFAAMRALIAGLVQTDFDVVVMTHERFADEVGALGARFVDLFDPFPLEPVDPDASPAPVRYVSYAGRYVDEILPRVRELDPALVVYEGYAVVGNVVARLLGVPYVAVVVQHDFGPDVAAAYYADDPRVTTTADTERAVGRLRELGLEGMNHLSFATALSPHLNVYCEPPEFLQTGARAGFEPVAFFGSIARRPLAAGPWFAADGRTRVYVSFGSYLLLAFREQVVAVLTRIVDGLAADSSVEAVVSLGTPDADPETVAALVRPNVRVERWVDQPAVLAEADVFVTHHGLASTHDAVDQRVPMLSYPFFGDQPSQAALCQSLGIALPLGTPEALPSVGDVGAAVANVTRRRPVLLERLGVVRGWEEAVNDGRPEVLARIRALVAAHR